MGFGNSTCYVTKSDTLISIMSNCVFCQSVQGLIPRTIIYETETVLAIKDKYPVTPGHTLVIPKKHVENILDIDELTMMEISKVIHHLAPILKQQYQATGINVLNANGRDAGQSVFHLHFHLIPRHPNDGLHFWPKRWV